MAKKITDQSVADTLAMGTDAEGGAANAEPPSRKNATSTKTDAGEPPEQPAESIPDYADRILRIYRQYKEMYIDPSGGTYTCDTPPTFRSDATLFRNPYYKS